MKHDVPLVDRDYYYWITIDVFDVEINGENPGEKLVVDFKARTPMDMIVGSYDPESDNFSFGYTKKIPDMIFPILKEKIMQKIGHTYGDQQNMEG